MVLDLLREYVCSRLLLLELECSFSMYLVHLNGSGLSCLVGKRFPNVERIAVLGPSTYVRDVKKLVKVLRKRI